MSTVLPAPFTPATPVGRIINVVRLHLANPWTTIFMPWIVLFAVFLANLAIWWIIYTAAGGATDPEVTEGLQYSGATSWIFVYMIVVAAQAMSVTFPFALGFGVTRRDFYLGSAVTFVLLSAMYSIGMTVLSVVEDATNGWGIGGRMFSAVYFGDSWPQRLFIYFAIFLFFFFVGAAIASIWVRWRATGLTVFFIALGALAVAGVALVTFTANWASVGGFFLRAGFIGSFAWSLVLTALAAVTGFVLLRRATPRN